MDSLFITQRVLPLLMLLPSVALHAQAAQGSIGFTGSVVEHSRFVQIGEDLQVRPDPAWHGAMQDQPLTEARNEWSNPMLDYFAGYAHEDARLITVQHR